ncbi:ribose-phosphate diphosphokinase [Nitrososphaera viennensis]|uniref:ribose-phosphate diphosphokinase n=2 Tax=Nitrososphaera viennensis TaxID=1034015 RepID=A0A060HKY2_9ARCH|nr:ribose-phosphate pyrophosphokinase [Nitrososphaera viennensis]AIC14246.1 ribose-phosphate pyrophosphokinase [Nitrososphaera viennensis EN76]UVS69242.1 ribose-phosphate pyrophosphokinase [Nitrososphaera viennensis]
MAADIISVVAGPSSPELAAGIARHLGARLVQAELRVFSDGESKIRLAESTGKKCVIVQSTYPPTDTHLMQAMMMAKKCADNGAEVCAVIPYLAYARQDRAFLEGEAVSVALVAKLLAAAGARSVVTVDIHSEAALAFFSRITNVSSMPLLAAHAAGLKLKNALVVSPDMGGICRAQEFARLLKTDMIALKKSRDRSTGEVTVEQKIDSDISGRDAILIDDMISSGGSIVKAAEVLRKNGAGRIYAMCAHALLIGDAASRIAAAGVQEIIATNSIPGRHATVDLSGALAEAVRKTL